jgi:DNA-binding HxlR family transcriptional regulator
MNHKSIRGMRCSIARALSAVGDRWTLLIVREAFLGVRRFENFQTRLALARNILTLRLRGLVSEGILIKSRYQEKPDRYEYRLTDKGLELYPVILALMGWGDHWMADESGPPVTLTHKTCNHATEPVLACSHCGRALRAREIRVSRKAGAPA